MARLIFVGLLLAPLAACGGGPTHPSVPATPGTSQPADNPPQIVSAAVTPSIGFDEATQFTAHVEARDPDGDSLSVAWTNPLGIVVSEQRDFSFVRRGQSPAIGSPLSVAVTDGKGGRATARVDFVAVAFTGSFDGAIGEKGGFSLVLTQNGNVVTGTIFEHSHVGVMDPAEPGHVNPDGSFRLRFKLESLPDLTFVGTLVRCGSSGEGCLPRFPNRSYIAVGQLRGGRFDGESFTFGIHTD